MRNYDYQQIIEALQKGVCRVTFTKVDGSNRVMFATLQPELLPEMLEELGNQSLLTEGDGDNELVTVWDTQVDGWRRFRVSSVIDFTDSFGVRS